MSLLDKMLGAMKYDEDDEFEDDGYYDDYDDDKSSRSVNKRAVKSQTIDDNEDAKAIDERIMKSTKNTNERSKSHG